MKGMTARGVDANVKDTMDLQTFGESWNDINTSLKLELEYNIEEYMKSLDHEDYKSAHNNTIDMDFSVLHLDVISDISQFMVQKYNKNKGRYVYHNDFSINQGNRNRVLTYLWYLNDVLEGGETVFSGIYNIKPRCGTLALFPASWTFPHCGKMPLSSDKYIITGWIYQKHNINP
jgi:hypothetical protein